MLHGYGEATWLGGKFPQDCSAGLTVIIIQGIDSDSYLTEQARGELLLCQCLLVALVEGKDKIDHLYMP